MSEQEPEEDDDEYAAMEASIDAAYERISTEIDAQYAELLAEYGGED